MAERSNIEWCDSTFNPWVGCTKISPACDHCYAEALMDTRMGRAKWGAGQPRARTSTANWQNPLRWDRADFRCCDVCGWRGEIDARRSIVCPACMHDDSLEPARRRVFCASLADVFDNEVPIEWLVDLVDLIRRTPNIDWLLLTKRIGNVLPRLHGAVGALDRGYRSGEATGDLCDWIDYWTGGGAVPRNVWLGATICNQAEADRDIPKLLATPAEKRFLSIEPMLGPIDLTSVRRFSGMCEYIDALRGSCWTDQAGLINPDPAWSKPGMLFSDGARGIDWIIAGGESGPHARPSHPAWFRSLRDQCAAADVPFLFKQWGDWVSVSEAEGAGPHRKFPGGATVRRVGKKTAGRLLDGRTQDGFPA
ncbi:MAG: phage Gp37/Gp68 family protein [Burkholderiales bacterium]|nr:phage Gp37/Gp68 family protein [Burkholderiales bacterium]